MTSSASSAPDGNFITQKPEFLETLRLLKFVIFQTSNPILLIGPAGVGKSTLIQKLAIGKGNFETFFCTSERIRPLKQVLEKTRGRILFLREAENLTLSEQMLVLTELDSHPETRIIASSTHNLVEDVRAGSFRSDLYAALSVWTFTMPVLAQRQEDFSEFLEQELCFWSVRTGKKVEFPKDAQVKYLRFAKSLEAVWSGNFRDLRSSVTRMAVLALQADGTISSGIVAGEIARLKVLWAGTPPVVCVPEKLETQALEFACKVLGAEKWNALDRFDRPQLADVLWVCRQAQNFSEAGRILFAESRLEKKTVNDSDRMRKYLLKFGLSWHDIQKAKEAESQSFKNGD